MAVKPMKRDLGVEAGLTATRARVSLCFPVPSLLVQRPWSPANRQASTRAVKPNSANGGVLKAGMGRR